ncbi:hypothetical protein F5890DRAFT_1510894 [Lentinula detonsa]|uniref:Uncharacterized protein n=1 Tax=Lentinula detonsa TaxID=2804962 RepID=A0AA38UU86_9AGAR|nr:hypothetical protein F5890DRAFT_1510894 [Lentinula detonsa]
MIHSLITIISVAITVHSLFISSPAWYLVVSFRSGPQGPELKLNFIHGHIPTTSTSIFECFSTYGSSRVAREIEIDFPKKD